MAKYGGADGIYGNGGSGGGGTDASATWVRRRGKAGLAEVRTVAGATTSATDLGRINEQCDGGGD
jgi:hypothetical protein